MKIASYNTAITQQTFLGSSDWRVVWNSGTVEPASSGGPLFNNNRQIIGQVHGGNPADICTSNDHAFFGRFDISWTGGGTNATRLSNWLDPSNTGAMTTNTRGILSIQGPEVVCGSATYQLSGAPSGAPVTWTASSNLTPQSGSGSIANVSVVAGASGSGHVSFNITGQSVCSSLISKDLAVGPPNGNFYPSGYPEEMAGTPIQFFSNTYPVFDVYGYRWYLDGVLQQGEESEFITIWQPSTGNHRIELEIANECGWSTTREGMDFYIQSKYGYYSTYPNPAEEEFTVTVEPSTAETATVDLYNNQGRKMRNLKAEKGQKKITVDVRGLAKGNYFLHIIQNGKTFRRQVIIGE